MLNSDYKSKIQFDLRNYVNLDDDEIEYCTVGLPNCVMTNSNYIVNEYNNKIIFVYGGLAPTVTFVPYGNYTKTTWISQVNSSVSTALPNDLFTLTGNVLTNKFTITTTALYQSLFPGLAWGFNDGTTCDYIFGFRTSFSTTANSYVMDRVFNFLPVPRFVFHCNILSSGITMINGGVGSCDVLAVIPNSSRLNSQIIYENNTKTYLVKSNASVSNIVITITDDDNRLINFNGISAYFDIQFNIFRRSIMRPLRFKQLVEKAAETAGQYDNIIIGE